MAPPSGPSAPFDRALEALRDRYRRQLLFDLRADNPLDLTETGPPHREPGQAVGIGGYEVLLHHKHLPKLEQLQYIRWDADGGAIRQGPKWREIEPFLRVLADNRPALPTGLV